MSWIKSKQINDYRNPKMYQFNDDQNQGLYLSKQNLFNIIVVLVVIIIIWIIFFSGFFKVKNVIINGSLNTDIQKDLESFKGKNIFTFIFTNKEKELAQRQSSVKMINIIRGIPDTLKIDVIVRNPLLAWKTQDKSYFVDEKGIIFEQNSGESLQGGKKLPLIVDMRNLPVQLGQKWLNKEFIDFVVNLNDFAPEYAGLDIMEVKVNETTFQIEAMTDKNIYLKLDSSRNAQTQLKVLKKILDQYGEEIKEYVDLRVEGRVYYK